MLEFEKLRIAEAVVEIAEVGSEFGLVDAEVGVEVLEQVGFSPLGKQKGRCSIGLIELVEIGHPEWNLGQMIVAELELGITDSVGFGK